MGPTEWAILIALSVLWGGAFFFLEIMLRAWPPFTVVLARVGLGALVLWLFMRATGRVMPRGWPVWRAFAIVAFLGNAMPFVLFAWGQQRIDSGLASILNATTPLWGVVAAHLFTRDERATPAKIIGVGFGLAGVVAMIGGEALEGVGVRMGGNAVAQGACLVATLGYALAGVYARKFVALGVDPWAASTGQLAAAAIMLVPFALVEAPWTLPAPDATVIGATIGMVVLATAIPYVLYFRLIERAGAGNAFLCTFLIPVVAILLGVLVLGERLELRHLTGMALIAIGLAAIDGRIFARFRTVAPGPDVP
ncbi:DMT family transporter [Sphingomonas sp. SUN039]|uniref:DMT family transporter n=1 Tax=Sphingomonas sp. SUN039 TaxID=2937787 RepID=UPI00216497CF|nr:DMT family transporter [Sphingomonas sp. SUN039]UVO52914.1 DMT family transporter [Sphingomonas sp. SUN039]